MEPVDVHSLIAYAHVRDLPVTIDFYEQLGFRVKDEFTFKGTLVWAHLESGNAGLMIAQASYPIDPHQQGILFYLHCRDVAALRDRLADAGISAGPITDPHYMLAGEIRVADPDGYVLLIGQPPAA